MRKETDHFTLIKTLQNCAKHIKVRNHEQKACHVIDYHADQIQEAAHKLNQLLLKNIPPYRG